MNNSKRSQLVITIKSRGYDEDGDPVLVTRQEFFDGNDDRGSIGYNLSRHPGMEAFDSAFESIEALPEVSGVYFAISELLDEDDMWPLTDTAYIVTTQSAESFRQFLAPLDPETIEPHEDSFANPPVVPPGHSFVQVSWE